MRIQGATRRAAWLLTVAVLLTVSCAHAQQAATETEQLPAVEWKDQAGRVVQLSDYAGKVVVLNFWATWCGPCVREMPIFVEMSKKYADQGVVVLAASLDLPETQGNIPAFIEKQKVSFPVLTGTTVDHMQQFGMGESLPGTLFIDQQGKPVSRILGDARKKEVIERVEWLLGLRKGKKPPKPLVKHL